MATIKKENLIEGWHIVMKYLKPYRAELMILMLLSVLSAILGAMVPYLAGKIVDYIVSPRFFDVLYIGHISSVFFVLGIWLFVRAVNDIVDWSLGQRTPMLSVRMEAEYIASAYAKLIELPLSFHKTHKMGEVSNRISRGASWLDNLVNVLIRLAPQFLSIIFALAFSLYIQAWLALILFIGVVLYLIILIPLLPKIAAASHRTHSLYSDAYGDSYDVVLNVSAVKQATAEQYESRKLYKNFVLKAYRSWTKMRGLWGIISISQRLLITLVQFFVFVVGIQFIMQGKITIGELLMFNGYAAMFFGPFVQLGYNWETIQNGIITLQRAEKILTNPPEMYVPKNAIIADEIHGDIVFDDVYFSYTKKQREALRGISFHVKSGETVALVGESGVGKSTLIDLLSHYYKPTSGNIHIDGHNIEHYDLKFLRSQIAVVPQEIILFNDSIRQNICYGAFDAPEEAIVEAAREARADEFIESFPKKYKQMVGERGVKLSMGQKQRIAIARAILRNPKILILDEPTSALDAKSEQYIQDSFSKLMKGRTTFIIAHRLSTVRNVDKIFVLEKGRIVESGNHEELVKKEGGIYQKLYSLQIGLS